jgi:long-chain acyl-CoA synthetase
LAYEYWKKYPERVKRIIVFKNDELKLRDDDTISIFWDDFVRLGMEASEETIREVKARSERGVPEDMATLIYTSGTTGQSKGVVITHANYDAAIDEHLKVLTSVTDEDLSMSFLPMSHILEKAWSFYCITRGVRIAVNYDPRVIADTLHEVHPTLMCCVPRFWEKVYAGVKEKLAAMSGFQRLMVKRALACGHKRNIDYLRNGKKVPKLLEKEYQFWDKKLYSVLRNAIGIPNANFFPTAGAMLSDTICEFMRSVGIRIVIGYGLSETTATVSFFPNEGYEIGTVGQPLPCVKVRIDNNGEILVKGPTVTSGYYNNPEANADAFTEDGYFRTGDCGFLKPSGAIVLTERLKDLFKTSNGKYIAPQLLESRLAENKYIADVAVIGDKRKFVSALVVPNLENLRTWAAANGINGDDAAKLCADKRAVEFILSEIAPYQADLAEFEKIKRITLLPESFSIERGELTNTLKIKRPVVAKNYADKIDAMYSY